MLHRNATVPRDPAQRSNSGGRPVRPTILALEAHVEEIVALKDDADLLRRSAVAEWHLLHHAEGAQRDGRQSDFDRATTAIRKLIRERMERARRLVDTVIPEVTACYAALEAAVG